LLGHVPCVYPSLPGSRNGMLAGPARDTGADTWVIDREWDTTRENM
jgi:hypothetical protein